MKISGDQAVQIRTARDCALHLVRTNGKRETVGPLTVQRADLAGFMIVHRTPFSGALPVQAAPPYQHALAQQRAVPDLPYSIEVWFGGEKRFFVQWNDDTLQVISFRPGAWESELASIHEVA
jgi:hypothetical protein